MGAYGLLLRFTSPAIARFGAALWFALLIVLVLFCSFEPQAEFRYGNI